MSSGRDVMMDSWSEEDKRRNIPYKTHLERMEHYRETLLAEIERLDKHIKECKNEQNKA